MGKRIESKGQQLFNVPNTDEGRQFLYLAKKFLNKNVYSGLKKRSRGSRPRGAYDCPEANAKWFAVYGRESDAKRQERWDDQRAREKSTENYLKRKVAQEILKDIGKVLPNIKDLV